MHSMLWRAMRPGQQLTSRRRGSRLSISIVVGAPRCLRVPSRTGGRSARRPSTAKSRLVSSIAELDRAWNVSRATNRRSRAARTAPDPQRLLRLGNFSLGGRTADAQPSPRVPTHLEERAPNDGCPPMRPCANTSIFAFQPKRSRTRPVPRSRLRLIDAVGPARSAGRE